ncbi:MAG: hypothetical protein JW768_08390, partial [Chitinispirillaceae bacterium]|nr:hypothetical protein [Chitinispirillaceae bacterium]
MKRFIVLGATFAVAFFTGCQNPINPQDKAAMAVSAGAVHTMFLKYDGTLWAFGENYYGQLGTGDTTDRRAPIQVMSDVAAVSAGGQHTMILKKDGSLWATGYNNSGQLGDGTTAPRNSPVQIIIPGGGTVSAVSAGSYHTMILKSDGTLWATGYNNYGQLGDNSTSNRLSPVYIMAGVRAVSAGINHTMIIRNDGRLLGTGYNRYGQLCRADSLNDSTPRLVSTTIIPTGAVVRAVVAGENSTLFLRGDTLWGAGRNNYGELGVG